MGDHGRYIFGVDGGGTNCRVVIHDLSGAHIGKARGGPANYTTDPQKTLENLRATIADAAQSAALTQTDIRNAVAHAGLAGVLTEEHASTIVDALPFSVITVSDDRETSAIGALGADNGVLAAVGTGSFIAARQGSQTRFFGGWGFRISDQASGAWLGRAALQRCVLAIDGLAEHSALTRHLLDRFGGSIVGIVDFAKQASAHEFATLAPAVMAAARDGDTNGIDVVRKGADYLNACFSTANIGPDDVICLTGGVGPHYAPYLLPQFQARITPAKGTAIDGALALARKHLPHSETPT